MRLREIQQLIKEARLPTTVNIEGLPAPIHGEGQIKINNIPTWRNAALKLKNIPALEESISPLTRNIHLMQSITDSIIGPISLLTPLRNQLETFRQKAADLQSLLEHTLPQQPDAVIVAEIPHPETLEALSELIKDFHTLFRLINRADYEGRLGDPKVVAFDSGSFYIEMALATWAGVKVFGALVSSVSTAARKYQEYQLLQQQLQINEIAIDELKSIQQYNESLRKGALEKAIKSLQAQYFPKADQEALAALTTAAERCTHLITSGVRILPAASAPEDVRKEFPSTDELKLFQPPDAQKMLGANSPPEAPPPKGESK